MARKLQIIHFDGTSVALPMPVATRRLHIGDPVELGGVLYRIWYEEDLPGHRNFRAEREMTAEEFVSEEVA